MNLRTLKKKSKQAVPILKLFPQWVSGELFPAERHDNYHGMNVRCSHKPKRKSWGDERDQACFDCSSHPLKGTPMIGGMSGYYEPEWDEKTAFGVLQECVFYEDRPAGLSSRQWKRVLAVAQVSEAQRAAHHKWMAEGQ